MNNPSAFPRPLNADTEGRQGMTLRDYFAAAAMQGDMSALQIDDRRFALLVKIAEIEGGTLAEVIAREAYVQADAMLKAREL